MSTTILRFEKVKSFVNIHKLGAHQHRYAKTPNANPLLVTSNQRLIGSKNIAQDVRKLIKHYKIKPRKNAVLAMDCLLTLSPELFTGEADISLFKKEAVSWLQDTFGHRCVNAVLHLDETSPHCHAVILPLTKNKKGKIGLNARDLFNPTKLSQFQRSFNQHMHKAFPDVAPPNHGSKAKHKKIRAFYEELEKDALRLKEKRLKLYEIELRKKSRLSILKCLEVLVPRLNKWVNKLETELRQEIGEHSKLLVVEYHNKVKNIKNALELELEGDKELNEMRGSIDKSLNEVVVSSLK